MNKTLFRVSGMLIGLCLMFAGIAWSADPDAHSYLLFAGGVAVLAGSKPVREQQS